MKKVFVIVGAIVVLAFLVASGMEIVMSQRADYGWNPGISNPRFTAERPCVLIDEAHHNASTAGIAGRYWPFARLLRADGYLVERAKKAFTMVDLNRAQVLVIANASGAPKPQAFGINLPVHPEGLRRDPAFTAAEVEMIRSWVERGGSLLLIADHAPFGESAASLGSAFGVTMHKGFTEIPDELSDPLLFSAANGRLGDHPIVKGDGPGTAVERVMTFTGQSIDGPACSTALLRLPSTAIEYVPVADSLVEQPAGLAQGVAFDFGKGRVVVLGEAAMMTAQVSRRIRFGMNLAGNDNLQFARNVMSWLSRKL